MAELDEKRLAMMKNKIFFIEKKNVLSKAKKDAEMQAEIRDIINKCEKMQLGGSLNAD